MSAERLALGCPVDEGAKPSAAMYAGRTMMLDGAIVSYRSAGAARAQGSSAAEAVPERLAPDGQDVDMTSTAVGAVVPLVSVFLGAMVTYWVNVRTKRRSSAEELVNAAIAAVAVAEANQTRSTRVNLPDGFEQSDREELARRLALGAIESHNLRAHEAREALAKVTTLDSRIREYYLDPDAVFQRPAEIIQALTEIRQRSTGGLKPRKDVRWRIGG
ncbi:hypothetical protein ACFORO_21600 [Amycolatopsis halotolerans]|uniref:DUF4129 domain-containing protein n=1 Tax=Amycolatopsis halotolerans TaxID=330083 RepID=A0ABV7QKC2_9PSEU